MQCTVPHSRHMAIVAGVLAGLLLVALGIGLWRHFDATSRLMQVLAWLQGVRRDGAAILFTALYALVVVLMLPGVVFTLGAGFVFGTLVGTFCVLVGTTVGATGAFFLGRFLFQSRAQHFMETHAKLRALSDAVSASPWQSVMLSRMIPFFPFKASNYAFGSMDISYRDFVLGTVIGIVPFTLTNVYAGSLVGDLAALNTRGLERTPLEWAVYAAGLPILALCVALLGRRARAQLEHARPHDAAGSP